MRLVAAISILATIAVTPVLAADARFIASLGRLDSQTRLEQICDYEAMTRIGSRGRAFRPDRAKSNVVTPPRHLGDTLIGTGGAFRSEGRWYQFSFTCKASPDHLSVLSFSYLVGAIIPEAKWDAYGLWR
jgi:hypothetical protein